jgi:hypothetical protein
MKTFPVLTVAGLNFGFYFNLTLAGFNFVIRGRPG